MIDFLLLKNILCCVDVGLWGVRRKVYGFFWRNEMGCGFLVKRLFIIVKWEESGNILEGGRCFYVDGVIFCLYLLCKIEKGNLLCIFVFFYFMCLGRVVGVRRFLNWLVFEVCEWGFLSSVGVVR